MNADKLTWNTNDDTFTADTANAIQLRNEYVCGIHEYAKDELLVTSLVSKDVLKFSDGLAKITVIKGTDRPNEEKTSIIKIPGFNVEANPFLVVTGKTESWLVNVGKNAKAEIDEESKTNKNLLI